MIKKSILTGAVIAGLLTPPIIYESALRINSSKMSALEKILKENKKIKILIEERRLLEKDKIYRIVDSSYKNLNDPEYIPYSYKNPIIPGYISKKFVRTLIKVESKDNPKAVSRMGARGLGQLMKGAWYEVEREDYWKNVFIPEKNIDTTIKYLMWIDKTCKILHPNWNELTDEEKTNLIAAAYNGGIGRLQESNWDIHKMPDETRKYIPKLERVSKEFIPSAKIYQSVF